MTTASGGNISVREENGDIWTTPGGIDKGSLTPEDMVCVKNDGSVHNEYGYDPISEFPSHRAIYRKRKELNAIIHAHSPALVSFSMARKVPETTVIPRANNICGKVGYAPYRISGSQAPEELAQFLNAHGELEKSNPTTSRGGIPFTPGDYDFQPYEALFPIPADEILINEELTQNPGY